MHPLMQELSNVQDKDLDEKITKLRKVMHFGNYEIVRQAQMIMDSLLNEQTRRANEKLEKQLKKSGKKLDEVINIS